MQFFRVVSGIRVIGFAVSYTHLTLPTIMKRLGHCPLDVTLAYLRGREAEGEQEQNFANQSALAVYT